MNVTPAFRREGFGRQSMSEKRKGHIDPKSLDLYQKLKQSRDKTHSYGRFLEFYSHILCECIVCQHRNI